MTERMYEDDAQLAAMQAHVVASGPDGVVLDRTVFYARGGGQPGDVGTLRWDGGEAQITDTMKGEGERDPAPGRAGRRAAAGRRGGVGHARLGNGGTA